MAGMELELISWLRARFPQAAGLVLGLGDDAALLELEADEQCVVTTDMLLEGVHFPPGPQQLARVGRKALAVNLSDIAAMAARPIAAFVSLALPRSLTLADVQTLYEGMAPLAERYGVALAGGDTNVWNGPLVVNVAVLGACPAGAALRRSGARPGDAVLVTGPLGGSLEGKHFDFEPRIREALQLRSACSLHAGCDLSDGLALDLWRILAESGVGAVLDECQVPVSDAARRAAAERPEGGSALERALSDGEDFELLVIVDAADADRLVAQPPCPVPLTRVGQIVTERGLWLRTADGTRHPLAPRGYVHGQEPR